MSVIRPPSAPLGDYTVGLIFAMEFEMSAFRYMLDEEHDTSTFHKEPKDPNEYILGRVGGHNVVLAWLPGEQGKGAAAVVATHLDRSFGGIQWRFLVGIGGGVPSERHDIRLGDVVISMPEAQYSGTGQYDLGRETENGYEPKGFLHAPPAYLRSVVGKMRSNHLAANNQIPTFVSHMQSRSKKLKLQYRRPLNGTDILFQDDVPHSSGPRSCSQCDHSRTVNREARDAEALVEVHYGLIASGDAVIVSNSSRIDKIDKLGADVLCFDMEAAGVLSSYECLVIRGISDYADQHKMRNWRQYAAATAAACAKEVMLLIRPTKPVTWRGGGGGGGGGGGLWRARLARDDAMVCYARPPPAVPSLCRPYITSLHGPKTKSVGTRRASEYKDQNNLRQARLSKIDPMVCYDRLAAVPSVRRPYITNTSGPETSTWYSKAI